MKDLEPFDGIEVPVVGQKRETVLEAEGGYPEVVSAGALGPW